MRARRAIPRYDFFRGERGGLYRTFGSSITRDRTPSNRRVPHRYNRLPVRSGIYVVYLFCYLREPSNEKRLPAHAQRDDYIGAAALLSERVGPTEELALPQIFDV